MTTLQRLARIFWQLNFKHKLLKQCYGFKGYTQPGLCYSDQKSCSSPDASKATCKKGPTPPDVCVKAETLQVLSQNEPTDEIPKDCGKMRIDPSDASLRPFVNPCRPHPPCDPCLQPVHPCREKPPRIPVIREDIKTELSLRTKKILVALSAVLGGIIIYKALTQPEKPQSADKRRPRCVLRPQFVSRSPEHKEEIPTDVPYLIVGGGTAAFSAFRTIKTSDPTARILLICSEPYNPYMRPPLVNDLMANTDRSMSRELRIPTGKSGQSRSIFYEPEEFFTPLKEFDTFENGSVSVIRGWSVDSIDTLKKTVKVHDGPNIKYNKCLLATGSRAKNIGVFECNTEDVAEKVTAFRTVYDYLEVEDIINCGGKKIAIIGSNNIACRLASSLASRGIEVIQIFKENGVLSKLLPEYLSDWVTKKLEKEGVTIMKKSVIEDAMVVSGKLKLITKERKGILVDHTVVVTSSVPNTDFAEASAIEVDGKIGGFLVNPEFQVRSDLYAAGDCASFFDPKLGKRRRLENHDHAISTGRIAGENMVGGKASYDRESTFWTTILPGVEFEAVGEMNSEMPTVGIYLDKENLKKVEDTKENKIEPSDEYNRGVLFYLSNKEVVGIALWNMIGKVAVAQTILRGNVPYENLDDSVKLFSMHVP